MFLKAKSPFCEVFPIATVTQTVIFCKTVTQTALLCKTVTQLGHVARPECETSTFLDVSRAWPQGTSPNMLLTSQMVHSARDTVQCRPLTGFGLWRQRCLASTPLDCRKWSTFQVTQCNVGHLLVSASGTSAVPQAIPQSVGIVKILDAAVQWRALTGFDLWHQRCLSGNPQAPRKRSTF